jgi:PAS domain S-box-containing protein
MTAPRPDFAPLFEGSPEPYVVLDRSQRVVTANESYLRATGLRLDELVGRYLREVLPDDPEDASASTLRESMVREHSARAEAERAIRLKDEFLATVSHELRTPLTSMLGWVQMLRGGKLSEEQERRALETIERNARAQAQLIDDLLDVSRILAGKLQLDVQDADVGVLTRAAVESVRVAADARGIRLQPTLDSSAYVRGDPARLQQVIWNLLSNAVKFTSRGGRVRVVVARPGSSVEVTVSDSGRGIAPEFLPHVFERFRQEEGSTTRRHGGLGLGLAIVKSLTELHGGTVAVESEGEGKGSTFTVRLPLAAARNTEPHRSTSAETLDLAASGALLGVRLVVVDDEPGTRELMRALLERCGALVDVAASAAEGLTLLRRVRPDLLLSDVGMPGEDGYEFIRKVRALPAEEGGRTPAVAVTAHGRTEDRTRALLSGFRAHVSKPIEPAELVAVLASLMPPREEVGG